MDIEELKKLEKAATEGPWELNLFNPLMVVRDAEEGQETVALCPLGGFHRHSEANAALIVALRNHAKGLIAVAEAAKRLEEPLLTGEILNGIRAALRALDRKE